MRKEANITKDPHKAYYKDSKEFNGFNSEQDLVNLVASSNINQKLLLDYIKDIYLTCPLQNIFSNCYVSDVQLQNSLEVMGEIESCNNVEE